MGILPVLLPQQYVPRKKIDAAPEPVSYRSTYHAPLLQKFCSRDA